jgi:diaminohydroxyphosphoribosylaminopyrimidine deaminase/5-amino-6-(5-phosphoribosylamino)uracil reductase
LFCDTENKEILKNREAERHIQYMRRCFELARQGAGRVSPNPMVGAVLVYEGRIIGEGYHQRYGEAHAEVNAVRSVKPEDRPLICKSTIYVSLEPCCIHGKTPPCTDLIIRERIPRVVISVIDQTAAVAGQGVERLKKAGVQVITGILASEGERLSGIRNTFVSRHRPYIILKTAQSADGFIGRPKEQVWLTNAISKRLVHRWRSEVDAILVGKNTLLVDDPKLTNRLYFGKQPVRVVIDRKGGLPANLQVFDGKVRTLYFSPLLPEVPVPEIEWFQLQHPQQPIPQVLSTLAELRLTSLLVEGGAELTNAFLQEGLWDEWRVLTSPTLLKSGLPGPNLPSGSPDIMCPVGRDQLTVFYPK